MRVKITKVQKFFYNENFQINFLTTKTIDFIKKYSKNP